MFVNTNTISTTNAQELYQVNAIVPAFNHTQPQPKPEIQINAYCDLCSQEAHGTRQELQARGWGLHFSQQFCPTHQEMI